MSTFVDTSAIVAVLDRDDEEHGRANKCWQEMLAAGEAMTTSNYVLLETMAVIQRHLGMKSVRALQTSIRPALAVQWVDESLHEMATASMLATGRRQLSLVDCVSFAVMRRDGIRRAFSTDPHFREAGFEVLPE